MYDRNVSESTLCAVCGHEYEYHVGAAGGAIACDRRTCGLLELCECPQFQLPEIEDTLDQETV